MPCSTRIPVGMTAEQRAAQIKEILANLEGQLNSGVVKLKVASNGAVLFEGWNNRGGVNDACAFRALQVQGSFALRRALATAEALAGRKVDMNVINSGMHSHDGGHTWGSH